MISVWNALKTASKLKLGLANPCTQQYIKIKLMPNIV